DLTVSFSIEDAKKAKLFKPGGAWETYPKNMVYKSAISNLAKWLFPDVTGMAYVEGEIQGEEEGVLQDVEIETISAKDPETDDAILDKFYKDFDPQGQNKIHLCAYLEICSKGKGVTQVEFAKSALSDPFRFSSYFDKYIEKQSVKKIKDQTDVKSMDELI